MTALAAFWNLGGRMDSARCCERMLTAQAVYGQKSAQWSDAQVALGRRLFSILPEDRHDRGPVSGGEGKLTLIADVRLDNRDELSRALAIDPPEARLMSDSALLMRALERWDEETPERLVGDFAFISWDARRERLLLARDFAGQRPLHFHRSADFFASASMPKGLHALPEIPYGADQSSMAEFLALLPETGGRSFFDQIERVEPGHVLSVRRSGLSSRRYWRPSLRPLRLRSVEDYAEALREKLDQAVSSRLRGAEALVGTHLSGGLDSSAVASTAARIAAPSGGRVVAFTAVPRPGFEGGAPNGRFADEGPLAAATAALYPNVEHVLIDTSGRSPLDTLERDFFLYERPVLNLCNGTWTNAINDAARARRLSVMLTGQMGNMTLSYGGMELLPQLFASGRWLRLARESRALMRRGHGLRSLLRQALGPFVPLHLWRWRAERRGDGLHLSRYSALGAAAAERFDVARKAAERDLDFSYRPWRSGAAMRLWVMGRVDPGPYRKGQLGGWALDYRDPTADRRLVEFCLSVPDEQFLSGGVSRALAVRALSDRLPAAVLEERRRGYQGADWYEGLSEARGALRTELDRIAAVPAAAEALHIARLERLVEDWPTGSWNKADVIHPYRTALLRGVSAGHFLRKAGGANS